MPTQTQVHIVLVRLVGRLCFGVAGVACREKREIQCLLFWCGFCDPKTMAVPFALPDDDDGNAALEQIFNHIHELLILLQQQIQSRQAREEVGASSRGKKRVLLDLLLRVQGRPLDELTLTRLQAREFSVNTPRIKILLGP